MNLDGSIFIFVCVVDEKNVLLRLQKKSKFNWHEKLDYQFIKFSI